ncbi:hypothetical protein BC826DRAFT_1029891 [Russula brevipes]|nr:hypothetical protein BC826DRAFT_1029891 [Russula brevipes]
MPPQYSTVACQLLYPVQPPKKRARDGISTVGIAPRRSTIKVQCSTFNKASRVLFIEVRVEPSTSPLCILPMPLSVSASTGTNPNMRDPLSASDVRLAMVAVSVSVHPRPRAGLRLRGPGGAAAANTPPTRSRRDPGSAYPSTTWPRLIRVPLVRS